MILTLLNESVFEKKNISIQLHLNLAFFKILH